MFSQRPIGKKIRCVCGGRSVERILPDERLQHARRATNLTRSLQDYNPDLPVMWVTSNNRLDQPGPVDEGSNMKAVCGSNRSRT